jgi:hypothetical protein
MPRSEFTLCSRDNDIYALIDQMHSALREALRFRKR